MDLSFRSAMLPFMRHSSHVVVLLLRVHLYVLSRRQRSTLRFAPVLHLYSSEKLLSTKSAARWRPRHNTLVHHCKGCGTPLNVYIGHEGPPSGLSYIAVDLSTHDDQPKPTVHLEGGKSIRYRIHSLSGSRTPLSRVTGACTNRYTNRDWLAFNSKYNSIAF